MELLCGSVCHPVRRLTRANQRHYLKPPSIRPPRPPSITAGQIQSFMVAATDANGLALSNLPVTLNVTGTNQHPRHPAVIHHGVRRKQLTNGFSTTFVPDFFEPQLG
jgi:hypothetical protein